MEGHKGQEGREEKEWDRGVEPGLQDPVEYKYCACQFFQHILFMQAIYIKFTDSFHQIYFSIKFIYVMFWRSSMFFLQSI